MSIFIGLGANLPGPEGPPRSQLEAALARLGDAGVTVLRRSRWYRSPAWPDPADPDYVNGVAELDTTLQPAPLLAVLHQVEAALGRVRSRPNAPRPIDLDLLDYHGRVSAGGEEPILPHPRLHARAFVLLPLAELAPKWRHPGDGRGIAALIAALPKEAVASPLE